MFLLFTQCTGFADTSEKYSKTFFTVAILSYSCGSNCQPMEPWSSTHFSSREMWRQNLPNGRVFSLPRAGSPHACTFFFFKNLHLFTLLLISPLEEAYTHEYMACCWLSEPRSYCARGDAWRLTLKSYLLFGFSFVGSWHHSPPASRRLPRRDHGFVSSQL